MYRGLEEFLSHLLESGPGKKKTRKQKRKIAERSSRRHQKKTERHRKKRRQENTRRAKSGTLVKFVEITSIFDEFGQYGIGSPPEWNDQNLSAGVFQKRRLT